jgi:hypothetical protein
MCVHVRVWVCGGWVGVGGGGMVIVVGVTQELED